jgi:hypothetical protein
MKSKHFYATKIVFSILFVSVVAAVNAQNTEILRTDFNLHFSKNVWEVSPGKNVEFDIGILKSRSYHKSKIKMGVSSSLPQGVSITFNPDAGVFDSTRAVIAVGDHAARGQYLIVLTATLNNKTKGAIVKLLISDEYENE